MVSHHRGGQPGSAVGAGGASTGGVALVVLGSVGTGLRDSDGSTPDDPGSLPCEGATVVSVALEGDDGADVDDGVVDVVVVVVVVSVVLSEPSLHAVSAHSASPAET